MRVLYYDCFCGISGDMNLGALLDLGVDQDYLIRELSKLNIDKEFDLKINEGLKKGISGVKVDVIVKEHHVHETVHTHGHGQEHTHAHSHHHHHHHHDRNFAMIRDMIESSDLNDNVKKLSINMFHVIAVAEAKVHGKTVDDVHFHEVGAVDSIVDIVGSAICLDALKIEKIMSSSVQLGGGFVMCEHGKIPVPAPATTEILMGVPVKTGLVQKETTTPTGAAILKATVDSYTDDHGMVIEKTGYGLGTRDLEVPNVLRVFLGRIADRGATDYENQEKAEQFMIETNIVDMNAELYSYIEERLFQNGALDVYKTPIIMKKGRPAVKLSVLIRDVDRSEILDIIFTETTSGGIREYPVTKHMMAKKYRQVMTTFGLVQVKDLYHKGKCIKSKAEYDDCARIARDEKISIREVYETIRNSEGYKKG